MRKTIGALILLTLLLLSLGNVAPVSAAIVYQNLNTYTKWGADQAKITIPVETRVLVTELDRADEAILYKDFGAGHFDLANGIEHDFDFLPDETDYAGGAGSTSQAVMIWALANEVGTFQDLCDIGNTFLSIFISGNTLADHYTLEAMERKVVSINRDYSVVLDEDVQYWVKVTILGNAWKVGIYSSLELRNAGDATDGDVDNLSVTLSSSAFTWRYFYAAMSRENYSFWITAWAQAYDLHEDFPYLELFFNEGGEFRVNNGTVANGSLFSCKSLSIVELAGLPVNSSFLWANFTWDEGYNLTNPHDFTVTENMSIWCNFGAIPGEDFTDPGDLAEIMLIALIFTCLIIIAVAYLVTRRH